MSHYCRVSQHICNDVQRVIVRRTEREIANGFAVGPAHDRPVRPRHTRDAGDRYDEYVRAAGRHLDRLIEKEYKGIPLTEQEAQFLQVGLLL